MVIIYCAFSEKLEKISFLMEDYIISGIKITPMCETDTSLALLVTRNGLGEAPAELQQILVKNYFSLLVNEEETPDFICFYGDGVKLTCIGSNIIGELKTLESHGTKLIICKTCLNYFNIAEQVAIGLVGTMHDILDIQLRAGKVINL